MSNTVSLCVCVCVWIVCWPTVCSGEAAIAAALGSNVCFLNPLLQ